MELVQKDVVERGINQLLHQFKNKPRVVTFLTATLNQLQESEDSKFDLLNNRSIYTATGQSLDLSGLIVGQERLGRSDEEYRASILQKIAISTSNGTPNKLLQILQILTNAENIRLWEHYPANVILYSDNPEGDMNVVRQTLQTAAPAAVGNVGVIHDPTGLGFAPAEGLYSNIVLEEIVTNTGENIVDQNGNYIVAQTSAIGSEISILAEGEEGTVGGLLVEYYG